ncbi:hypothetical protein BOX15_Mlig031952g1, partial [Macrostomum lignano]
CSRMQQDSPTKTSISSASAAAAATAARTQTTHRQVGAGPQPPPEPLCQHSLGQCTNLRYPGHTVCARHLATTAPYTQSDQASLNQTPLQFCQYQTNSNAQSIRCGEVVERPKRFCHQHEPDPLPEPSLGLPAQLGPDAALQELLNSVSSLQNKPPEKYCFADAFQVSKFVRAKVSEPNPHRVRDRMSECASDTDSSLSDDPSDSEESTFPSTAEVFTRTEVVRAARCKLQALKTAYEDEVLRLQRELRQGYEKFVSSGGASAVGGSSASSSTPGGVASSIASSSLRRSAYEQCQVLTGTDKWLRHRATERRYYAAYIEQMKPPSTRRCSYSGPPSKCYERALPLSSYCLNHVLSEPNQCLFRACTQAGCTKPVIRFESSGRCDLHRGAEHYELPDDLLQSALDSANKVAKPQVFLQSPCTTPSKHPKPHHQLQKQPHHQQQHKHQPASSSASAQAQSHQSNLPPPSQSSSAESASAAAAAAAADLDLDDVSVLPSVGMMLSSSEVATIMRDGAFNIDIFSPTHLNALLRTGDDDEVNQDEKPTDQDEKPTDQDEKPTDQDEKPTDQDEKPTDQDEKPTDQDEKPTDQDEKTNNRDEKPTDRDEKPTDQDEKPTDRDEKPTDQDEKPTDRDEKPTDRDEKPTDRDEEPVNQDKSPYNQHDSSTNQHKIPDNLETRSTKQKPIYSEDSVEHAWKASTEGSQVFCVKEPATAIKKAEMTPFTNHHESMDICSIVTEQTADEVECKEPAKSQESVYNEQTNVIADGADSISAQESNLHQSQPTLRGRKRLHSSTSSDKEVEVIQALMMLTGASSATSVLACDKECDTECQGSSTKD